MTLNQIADHITAHSKIGVVSHVRPDGDTLGSACALMGGLISLGKDVRFYCSDVPHYRYGYMFDNIVMGDFDPELYISVDVAGPEMLGESLQYLKNGINIMIDHHKGGTPFAEICYIDPDAAATAEIIYELLPLMGVVIDKAMAECIYTAISTDTGCFRYRNTRPQSHLIAAEMMEYGVNISQINKEMFETKSRAQIRAEQEVLSTLRFFADDRIALVIQSQDILERTGARENEMDGIPSIPRKIMGVEIGITVKENTDGSCKLSLRSSHNVDVSAICGKFGGGGHHGAAGCTIEGSIGDVIDKIVKVCEESL